MEVLDKAVSAQGRAGAEEEAEEAEEGEGRDDNRAAVAGKDYKE